MVLGVFRKNDAIELSEESKTFINSLPPTFINLFRKKRDFLPIWSTHKYCIMIKSTYVVYYRASKAISPEERSYKYINLKNCQIKVVDDDNLGNVFIIFPENYRGSSITFAADSEKDRAKFISQANNAQRNVPSTQDFRSLKLIGKGHYGRVLLAKRSSNHCNHNNNQLYAIKEMQVGQVKLKVIYAERMVMEWVAEHPFVLGLDYAFSSGRSLYLISKFMPGGDLFLHLQNNGGSFPESVVKFYASELVLALDHLHSMHILHRDIKPENILLDKDGHIQLADMGLSKRLDSQYAKTKTMCGTDTYLPPEMVSRTPQGHGLEVDMWQLGCLLYELRSGYPPFYVPQSKQKHTHQRILFQQPKFTTTISSDFQDLLTALLEKDPSKRLGHSHGISEVKNHPWFAGTDWDKVLKKEVAPPVIPKPAGADFVNNFDTQFTEQPHGLDEDKDHYENNCFDKAKDFAGFDYVRPGLLTLHTQQNDVTTIDGNLVQLTV